MRLPFSHESEFCPARRYQQFNMDWDRKMGEFEHHASDLVEGMRQRHQVRFLSSSSANVETSSKVGRLLVSSAL